MKGDIYQRRAEKRRTIAELTRHRWQVQGRSGNVGSVAQRRRQRGRLRKARQPIPGLPRSQTLWKN